MKRTFSDAVAFPFTGRSCKPRLPNWLGFKYFRLKSLPFKSLSFKSLSVKWLTVTGLLCGCWASCYGQLSPLNEYELQQTVGRFEYVPKFASRITEESGSSAGLSTELDDPLFNSDALPAIPSLADFAKSDFNLTQGIQINLEIQASLSMRYEDEDGHPSSGQLGSAGFFELSGLHLGSSIAPISSERVSDPTPFLGSELALLNNLFIDVDSRQGMFITLEELGDNQGNGLDIIVNDVFLGNREQSAGGLLIENLSNFIQDSNLEQFNNLFGLQLSSVDDGKNTAGGNWMPIYSQVKSESVEVALGNAAGFDGLNGLTDNLGLPGFGANTTIDASFVVNIDKLAWVDDGNEFGLAGLMVYQGLDTNGDGIDDTVGPAKLTQMKIETITHHTYDDRTVQALYIANLDFKADIAIQSIYVGSPENSLGSLLIKGIDTNGTSLWIYPH